MAILWKRHKTEPRPVAVECPIPSYPHRDVEGDPITGNTYFETEAECWGYLTRDILAGVSLAGAEVKQAKAQLARAEQKAGEVAEEWLSFTRLRDARQREIEQTAGSTGE